LIGAAVGAATALLLAPSSGEELRTNIKTQVDTQSSKVQAEYQKGMQELQARVDKLSSELQSSRSKQAS